MTTSTGQSSSPYKAFEVLTDKQIPVRLVVNNFNTVLGEQLYIRYLVMWLSLGQMIIIKL
ncbi:hypothetical protein [Streptococcus equi]|uniref:hypothetical protein n=1 Tax=Streptococcus equi TaxID=1336 RepID=UPI0022AB9E4F|nr:hypothetical protein [Streptococcus equi]